MKNEFIYHRVQALVKKYKTRDPAELCKILNVNIKYLSHTTSLLGMYKVIFRNRYIFIPANVGELKNTVLAHELGHDQLHRDFCKNGVSFHENRIFNPTNLFEIEANIFAAHLLIPDENIRRLIKYSERDRDLAYELGVDLNLLNLKISEMAKMNLLDIDQNIIRIPGSDFLKKYSPENS